MLDEVSPADRLRGARLARNLSQRQLAALTGVSERTIQRYESGGNPKLQMLQALGAELGYSASWFVEDGGRGE